MTPVDLKNQLDEALFSRLSPRGFTRHEGEALSYVLDSPDESARRHVDVELHSDVPGLRVTLQEVFRDGRRRFELLEEFEGLHYYRYDPRNEKSVSSAVARLLRDFDLYGLRWLEGEAIKTPALAERDQVARSHVQQEAIKKGVESFKAQLYAEAVSHFEAASQLGPLDELTAKYRDVALRKARH